MSGALAVGVLGGVAVGRHADASAGVPYELSAADSSDAAEAVALVQYQDQDQPPAKDQAEKADRPRLRLNDRRLLLGIHGESTVRARGGGFAVYTWQRGAVTTASASSLSVKSADGVTWTWTLNADTKVRKNGSKATASALAAGDTVFVLGRPDGDARTAQGVVVPQRPKE
ncbi:hypothetical protein DQ384_09980 [Sphaerisporangium album]|uniref:Uncharacterized protein n=1 Tax=Sphaerisporangium album TaxID=509200 RepID=A0A367FPT4_9ACTN|nr:hypothetical protein DQ384_09980 [Sphaerisporangium album]